jgi:membrane fusion protein
MASTYSAGQVDTAIDPRRPGGSADGGLNALAERRRRLFREEAVEHQRDRLFGATTLAMPIPTAMTTGFLAACVAALICFAAAGSYARREHVSGFLVSTLGAAKIMPPRPGTVVAVYVAEGDLVEKGALLLSISDERTTATGQDADGSKLVGLSEQRSHLQEQVDLAVHKAEIERVTLQGAITSLASEIAALEAALRAQSERVQVAQQQINSIADTVAKGFISVLEFQRRRDNWLAQQQNEESMKGEILAKQGLLSQKQNELRQLPVSTAEQISRLKAAIAEIDIKLVEIREHQGYLLKAPIAGRVSALQAWVGKTVEPTIPQLTVVPDSAVLVAEVLVPARAIGFVTRDQPVRISYDTFPYQQFGFGDGTVQTVSHTLLKPDELVGPILVKEPSYRVAVALRSQSMLVYGKEIPLQADMQLQADIIFQRRSLLAWLLDPLLSAWQRSG